MQSRIDSLMESVVNIAIGLIISTIANWLILPAVLGVSMTLSQNLLIGSAFTIISLVRSYAIRRAFNGRSVWGTIKLKLDLPWVRCGGCRKIIGMSEYAVNWGSCDRCFDRAYEQYLKESDQSEKSS